MNALKFISVTPSAPELNVAINKINFGLVSNTIGRNPAASHQCLPTHCVTTTTLQYPAINSIGTPSNSLASKKTLCFILNKIDFVFLRGSLI